jgi:hypothetical protein
MTNRYKKFLSENLKESIQLWDKGVHEKVMLTRILKKKDVDWFKLAADSVQLPPQMVGICLKLSNYQLPEVLVRVNYRTYLFEAWVKGKLIEK